MEQVFYIDLTEVSTKEELQEALVETLPLPDYYGRNLDALYDVLPDDLLLFHRLFGVDVFAADAAGGAVCPAAAVRPGGAVRGDGLRDAAAGHGRSDPHILGAAAPNFGGDLHQ